MVKRFAARRHGGFSNRKRNALDDVIKNAISTAQHKSVVTSNWPPCETDPGSKIKVWCARTIVTIFLAPYYPGRQSSRVIVGDRQPYVRTVSRWYWLCLEKTQIVVHNSGIRIMNGQVDRRVPNVDQG